MKFCILFNLSPCARYCLLIGSQLTTWSQGNLHNIRLHFFSSIENFSAYCPVLRGSILLPPRHPSVFARMARWQLTVTQATRRCVKHLVLSANGIIKCIYAVLLADKVIRCIYLCSCVFIEASTSPPGNPSGNPSGICLF